MKVPTAPILAVTFDGDGTLWDVLSAARGALTSVAENINGQQLNGQGTVTVAELEDARATAERRHPDWPMAQLRRQSFADVLERHQARDQETGQLWTGFLDARKAQTRPFADAVPAVELLRERTVKTCLLSNGNTLPEEIGMSGMFDCVQVAEYAGVRKPDPEAFALAAKALDCLPEAILHVGDDERDDYEAALAAGFRAVLLCRTGRMIGDSISTLASVPGIVDDTQSP